MGSDTRDTLYVCIYGRENIAYRLKRYINESYKDTANVCMIKHNQWMERKKSL